MLFKKYTHRYHSLLKAFQNNTKLRMTLFTLFNHKRLRGNKGNFAYSVKTAFMFFLYLKMFGQRRKN